MLGPTKEMFDIMPTMGNKTEVNQILNGQDPAFFFMAVQHLAQSHHYQKKKEKKKGSLKSVIQTQSQIPFSLRPSLCVSDLKSLLKMLKNTKQQVLH